MDRLGKQLLVMGARAPSDDERVALRALTRGHASPGQQRLGMAYIMAELCGVGSVPFAGENSHGTTFRVGSQAVGLSIAMIADATLLRFPQEDEAREP